MAGKRSIFEEVRGDGGRSGPVLSAVGVIDRAKGARGGVRRWLLALAVLVAAMILVGGLTRLNDAGLSITEWDPVMGALPPMSEADWQTSFDAYRTTDEFRLENNAMTLAEFKPLFWWEWGHRQMGRLIGLVWAVGLAGFLIARRLPPGWLPRLVSIGALGGLQGLVGWWMVRSGLTGQGATDVASYRLALHLGLAFLILGLILWFAQDLARSDAELMKARRAGEPRLARLAGAVLALVFVQVLLGALVAGIDAGRGYTDWPLMAGSFFPEGALDLTPVWRNLFEDAGLVQFNHRIAGYILLAAAAVLALAARRSAHPATRGAVGALLLLLLLQAGLGIVTVMNSAPLALAILHQAGAILCLVLAVRARHRAAYPIQTSIRGSTL